ncbi:butyrophilin subfamily 1 member A1-like, partial [Misgurnus anguillicaudatus]|uniref:butyrophilin subfamily 1 member A1-like n=1 Tax=Misgurnus anguillicaudatus TaxID=75329 RepID=UPI003CCF21D1
HDETTQHLSDSRFQTCFLSLTDQFAVVGPAAPLLAVSGEDVILPCSLKPNISAVDMRVEWFRLDLKDSVVHLYEDHEDKNTNQLQSYRGRTEVFKDELQKGNTSLKLSRVQISDEGFYKCFIQSETNYDDITVDLRVEARRKQGRKCRKKVITKLMFFFSRVAVGSPPLITIDGFDVSGGLHLQCESKGWYPEPELVWLDSEGVTLTSETTDKQRETDGFRVKHMITVYNRDSKYHCRVKLRHHMMETEIITSSKMLNSLRSSVILISVGSVLGVIAGLLIAVFIYRHRGLQRKDQRLNNAYHMNPLVRERLSLIENGTVKDLKSLLRKYAVNVTLDPDSAHPHLIVSDDGKQVRYEQQSRTMKYGDQKSNNKFDDRTCVLGNEGFTSKCFYYEVQVKGLSVWFVGVARETAERKGWVSLSPESGYWVAGLRYGEYQASEDSSSVSLSLSVAPQRVGVFVDYEEGRVSFYDVESMCHIYSFTDQSFKEKLYPVFYVNSWYISAGPLIICSDLS